MHQGRKHRDTRDRAAALGFAATAPVSAVLGWTLGAPGLACALVVVLVGWLCARGASTPPAETDESLRAHLARARRRNEPVDLLVLRVDETVPSMVRAVRDSLRVTDSSYLCRVGGAWELQAMVDRGRLDRGALQARLSCLAARPFEVGWARFPEDGYTLGGLVARARAALGILPSEAEPDGAETAPALLAPRVAAAQVQGASE